MTGAEIVIRIVESHGVKTVFGYPGGSVLALYEALRKSRITHVLTASEAGAAHAAERILHAVDLRAAVEQQCAHVQQALHQMALFLFAEIHTCVSISKRRKRCVIMIIGWRNGEAVLLRRNAARRKAFWLFTII